MLEVWEMIYRGYEIRPVSGGFMWTDERGFDHGGLRGELPTEEHALNDIDQYKRNMARGTDRKVQP